MSSNSTGPMRKAGCCFADSGAEGMLVAGVFQFTPLKRTCLSHCRSPSRFIGECRRPGILGGFVMGLENGAFCMGCCWFLMAQLFV